MSYDIEIPKVFASYSWKPERHKEFVKKIVDRLVEEAGIMVIIDIYDLKVGQDIFQFMEQMVTNPEIKKVLVFSNQIYTKKANDRKGGVGTESTIISKKAYLKENEQKFIPICLEKDQNGEAFFPPYMDTKIYIDLSSDEIVEEGYEKLVRAIYDRPINLKPKLGKPPKFLIESETQIGTTHYKVERIKTSVIEGKSNSIILIEEYFEYFLEILTKIKIEDDQSDNPLDEKIFNAILSTKQLRNEFLTVIEYMIKLPTDTYIDILHKHIEKWSDLTALEDSYYNNDKARRCSQHYRFLFKELFMYIITIAIKKEKFDLISVLINRLYFIRNSTDQREYMNFSFLNIGIKTLDKDRNARLKSNKKSVSTDLLVSRIDYDNINFTNMQDTDRLLHYLALFIEPYSFWFPYLTMYHSREIELMKRAESKSFFNKIKSIFNVDSVNELKTLIDKIETPKRRYYNPEYNFEDPMVGLNVARLATLN